LPCSREICGVAVFEAVTASNSNPSKVFERQNIRPTA
jgi:hypothetical protein